MIPEHKLWELDAAYEAAMAEQARMTRMDEEAQRKLKALVLELYPSFGEWDADLIRAVDEVVWRSADRFVRGVEEAHAKHGDRRAGKLVAGE